MNESEELRRRFRKPDASDRPAPFWIWNEAITPEQIRYQLGELKARGFGGAFVHARPGMLTEYLSEEWWRLWSESLETAEEFDLKLYIYDENSYPSGFAGGHVPAALPDCIASGAAAEVYDLAAEAACRTALPGSLPGLIKAWAVEPEDGGANGGTDGDTDRATGVWRSPADAAAGPLRVLADVTAVPLAEWERYGRRFLVFTLRYPTPSRWLGGFTYVDLLRPEVTEHFLRTTHEQYRQRYGKHFGSRIPALFTDEPEITNGNLYAQDDDLLPFTYWFAARFEELRGYSLLDHLPCLLFDVSGAGIARDYRKVRYDFYSTIRELWAANSVEPISAWCREHGIAYTGHYVEHNWPHPFHRTSPAIMSMYEYMDWPAIDMLHTHLLKEDGTDAHDLVTVREAFSAANQLGKPRVLCEAYGAGGWESCFEDFRRIGDWLTVHGVNFLNQHLTFDSIAGPRKRDHPQSFDWRQPWWEEYGRLNDYFGRLNAVLSQGGSFARVLVLNPTTSTFLMTPRQERDAAYRQGVEQTRRTVQLLSDAQWDFDLGDEFILERHGAVREAELRIGKRGYAVVVIPPAVRQLKASTVRLLESFLAAGGQVLAMGDPLRYVDGEPDESGARLAAHPNWRRADTPERLDDALRRLLPPALVWGRPGNVRVGVAHLCRKLADGSALHFVVNSGPEPLDDELLLEGGQAERWDPWTGDCESAGESLPDGRVRLPVRLAGSDSLLLRIWPARTVGSAAGTTSSATDEALRAAAAGRPPSTSRPRPVICQTVPTTGSLAVQFDRPNILPLLYADLHVGSKSYTDVHTIYAAQRIFEHHGFAADPLDNGVQFRRRALDRDRFMSASSGFRADYTVYLDEATPVRPDIRLLAERPELYEIRVNGHAVTSPFETSWLDRRIGGAPIAGLLAPGRNTITLEARPFSVLHELEALYLEGDFAVRIQDGRWTIAPPEPHGLGGWAEQGYPFYAGAAVYRQSFDVPPGVRRAILSLPDWRGTIASVTIDGQPAGFIGIDRSDSASLDVSALAAGGVHDIAVRISGSMRNLLGPHFDPQRPRGWVWPRNWRSAELLGSPPPSRYDLIDYGLFREMRLTVETDS